MIKISNNILKNFKSTVRVLFSSTFPELIKVSTFAVLIYKKVKPYAKFTNHNR